MNRAVVFVACWLALVAGSNGVFAAGRLTLDGALSQGGLVIGRAEPGTTVTLDGKTIAVSRDGLFVLGFGRDAKPKAVLKARYPDGSGDTRTLVIAQRKYKVQRIDGLPKRQVSPGPKELKRIRADAAAIRKARARRSAEAYFRSGFGWPFTGRLSGVFGSQRVLNGKPRRPHAGVDIAAPAGTVIRAPADGVVALATPDMFFTGRTILLDHGQGLTSVYAHMRKMLVKPGQRVSKGQPIGEVGATGRVTGPHLHWGLHWRGIALDPALAAGPMPKKKSN